MKKHTVIPFGGIEQPEESQAAAGIIPAPLEATVSWGRGASLGPAGIMAASAAMELYDEVLGEEIYRRGILTHQAVPVAGGPEEVLAGIEQAVAAELAAGRLPVLVGGEHTVTLGALRALVKRRGPDFTVCVLDAHLDLRDEFEGSIYSHACVMRRALDLGLSVAHMGVRSCSVEEAALVKELGLAPAWAHHIHGEPDWLAKALAGVSGPVYISMDIDGLDPSLVPATGTPEPGGLFWHQAVQWLDALTSKCPVVGLDLVELAPVSGLPASDFIAARLLYRALGLALARADKFK